MVQYLRILKYGKKYIIFKRVLDCKDVQKLRQTEYFPNKKERVERFAFLFSFFDNH
jgi:hypothetical protein